MTVRPIEPKDADTMVRELYEKVGQALTYWMTLEGWLVTLLESIVDEKGDRIGWYVFSGIVSFQQKIKIINLALRGIPESQKAGKIAEDWGDIRKKLLKANETRNKIAHGQVAVRGFEVDGSTVTYAYLLPYPWSAETVDKIKEYSASLEAGEKPKYEAPHQRGMSVEDIGDFISELETEFLKPMMKLRADIHACRASAMSDIDEMKR